MTDLNDQRYPLLWPENKPRCRSPRNSAFKARSFAEARDLMLDELGRLGAKQVVLSTNIPLRNDGLPRSGMPAPKDCGVAVYFSLSVKGVMRPHAMAMDGYDHVEDNLYAIAKHIETTRAQERWGVQSAAQGFAGFAQLPPKRGARPWREVLGLAGDAVGSEMVGLIDQRFRALARERHPDVAGGSTDLMAELNTAREEALNEVRR